VRKNIWTTIFGVLAAVPQLLGVVGIQGIGHVGSITIDQLISGIGLIGLGALAKQFNVTGGTVAATPEAERRVP